jgi:hypothetical protein
VEDPALTARPWYREWAAPGSLAHLVVCTWAGQIGADGSSYSDAVLPDGCIDIVWDGVRLFVAGPDETRDQRVDLGAVFDGAPTVRLRDRLAGVETSTGTGAPPRARPRWPSTSASARASPADIAYEARRTGAGGTMRTAAPACSARRSSSSAPTAAEK